MPSRAHTRRAPSTRHGAALGRARAAAHGRMDLDYDLGCLEARAGHLDRAFEVLQAVSAAGLANDWAADHDLDSLHADPRWTPLLARVEAARAPAGIGGRHTAIPPSSGWSRTWRRTRRPPRSSFPVSGRARYGGSGTDGGPHGRTRRRSGSGAFALGLDPRRKTLHVTVASVPQAEGYRKADQAQSSLVTFALGDAAEGRRLVPPGDGPHLLGDLGLGPDGTVFVSDARAARCTGCARGRAPSRPWSRTTPSPSSQMPALTADGERSSFRTWTLRLFAPPLAAGEPRPWDRAT